MEQQLKQRLVGAITLVSLAVIFLPMIFDGSGYRGNADMRIETPTQPEIIFDQQFENMPEYGAKGIKRMREQINVRDLTRQSSAESAPKNVLKKERALEQADALRRENAKKEADALRRENAKKEADAPKRGNAKKEADALRRKDVAKEANPPEQKNVSKEANPPEKDQIIQAGAFSKLDNAKLRVNMLKQKGHIANYRKSGKLFIVEIGPESKESAGKIVAELRMSGIEDIFIRNQ